jgi:4'-phosphopantetheinyl transferase EntD
MADLFPSCVVVVAAAGAPSAGALHAAEEVAVSRAVPQRRVEFAATRACARAALTTLGVGPAALPKDEWGSVRWPEGVIGTLTHCSGLRAAAVARAGRSGLIAIGLDAEVHTPLPNGVLPLVARPEEMAHLSELSRRRPEICWDTLLFSAKEAAYKAWHPLTRRWLDFDEASVTFTDDGDFTVEILVADVHPLPAGLIRGRWAQDTDHVATATTVPGSAA